MWWEPASAEAAARAIEGRCRRERNRSGLRLAWGPLPIELAKQGHHRLHVGVVGAGEHERLVVRGALGLVFHLRPGGAEKEVRDGGIRLGFQHLIELRDSLAGLILLQQRTRLFEELVRLRLARRLAAPRVGDLLTAESGLGPGLIGRLLASTGPSPNANRIGLRLSVRGVDRQRPFPVSLPHYLDLLSAH